MSILSPSINLSINCLSQRCFVDHLNISIMEMNVESSMFYNFIDGIQMNLENEFNILLALFCVSE